MASMSVCTVYPCNLKFGDFKREDKTKRLSIHCFRLDYSKRITNIKNN